MPLCRLRRQELAQDFSFASSSSNVMIDRPDKLLRYSSKERFRSVSGIIPASTTPLMP